MGLCTRYWGFGQCVSTAVVAGSQRNQSGLMGRFSFAMRAPPSLVSSNTEAKGWACTISLVAFMTKPLPLPGIRITQPWGTLPIPGSSQLYSLSPAHKTGNEMHHVHHAKHVMRLTSCNHCAHALKSGDTCASMQGS